MGKVDVDRLIIYLWGNTSHFDCIECALEDQGLKIVNGEIVEIGAAEKSGNELNLRGIFVDEIKYLPWQRVKEGMLGELKGNEDEKIRKSLSAYFAKFKPNDMWDADFSFRDIVVWFEKQGEHANFRNKIQIGDKVTRNEEGVLINLSQLKRVAKKNEKQDEQKPADKVEPEFKVGEWVVYDHRHYQVVGLPIEGYKNLGLRRNEKIEFAPSAYCRHWTIQDAKDGDVLACNEEILLFKLYSEQGRISLYCWYNGQTNNFHSKEVNDTLLTTRNKICPATKEQRDLLFQKIEEAGYKWDSEKKELKKIEQKSVWSEEDEHRIKDTIYFLDTAKKHYASIIEIDACIDWLKLLKQRIGK